MIPLERPASPAGELPAVSPAGVPYAAAEPLVGDRATPRQVEQAADARDATPPVRHVLVADDEPHIGRIIQMKLEQGPFRVTLAFDGQQALDALDRDGDFDLVLLDLMMPNVSGLDVLGRLREDARYRDLPCIILTAAGQEQQYRRAMALGATDFMTKPFSPKKLYARAVELSGGADTGSAGGDAGRAD